MYIRQTKIKNSKQGVPYYTYRLVESVRDGEKVKQRTLLNLGKHFAIDKEHWPALTARIDQLLHDPSEQQASLFDLKQPLDESLEASAQRYTALILHKQSQPLAADTADFPNESPDYQVVDINHLKALKPRSIGAETLAWHAFTQLQLDKKLTALGFNSKDLAAVIGNIIGRMVSPGSELHTLDWLQSHSALGELLDHDFQTTSLTRLYTITDKLLAHQDKIEQFLYQRECNLFELKQTIVLYDLTNTFFEGTAKLNPKAQFGRSKEKRSDCPIVTMGLVMDGDGFPMNSKIFEGNISEAGTLEQMIDHLGGLALSEPPTVVMDAGIASEENIQWLKSKGFHYIVVSRKRYKQRPDEAQGAVVIKDEIDNKVIAQRVDDPDSGEALLYCHSEKREKKDQGIRSRFHQRFETALETLHKGLSKKGCTKGYAKIIEKIGRLKEKNTRVSQEYDIDVTADDDKKKAIAITWKRLEKSSEKDELSGVYCLRTDITHWSESTLWHTYVMLTDLEATFRSMKTELGLRPVYHQKEERVTAHLFITLLAYHLVHTLRYQLKQQGIDLSWQSLRQIMSRQQRLTITMPTQDKAQLFIRITTEAETRQQKIYQALGMTADGLGKKKTKVENK
jgi:transposase